MSGTSNVTFAASSISGATIAVGTAIAPQVQQALNNNITSLIDGGNQFITVAVETVSLAGGQTATLSVPGGGFGVQNHALIEGQAGGTVDLPAYNPGTGAGYSGEIVDVAGAVTVNGGNEKNGLIVFSAQSDDAS